MWRAGVTLAVIAAILLELGTAGPGYSRVEGTPAKSSMIFDVTQHGASGSDRNALGSIVEGESWLKLNEHDDFKNGQGIKIEHAGKACGLGAGCPTAPKPIVAVQGAPGSTPYTYQLAIIDEGGGVGPAGPATTIDEGPNVLGARNFNLIRWEPNPAACGYALYRNSHILIVLSGLTPGGYYDPPRGPAFTSSFKDMGLLPTGISYPDIPATPPHASLPDALVNNHFVGSGNGRAQA